MNEPLDRVEVTAPPWLTPCERTVFELLALGCSNEGIAMRRGVSKHTVIKQVTSLYAKLGVTCRREFHALLGPQGVVSVEAPAARATNLSDRELQVVSLVARGQSNKLIAISLGLALSTVSTLLTRARRKLPGTTHAQPT